MLQLEFLREEIREREVGLCGKHINMWVVGVVLVLLDLVAYGGEEMLVESSEELSVLTGGLQVESYNLAFFLEHCRIVEGDGIESTLLVVIGDGFLNIFGEICFILFPYFGQADGHMVTFHS